MTKRLYQVFLLITCFIYLTILISPAKFVWAGFGAFLIPIFLILNFLLFLWCMFYARRYRIYGIFGLILGIPFYLTSLSINFTEPNENDISVLSYNVRVFNVYQHLNTNFVSSKKMISWVRELDADVKCLQEFHNQKDSDIFNTTAQFGSESNLNSYVFPSTFNRAGHEFGLAIFTRLPIIHRGTVPFSSSRQNNHAIFVDVVKANDTIRVYNAHFESMSIDQNVAFDTDNIERGFDHLVSRLKYGVATRASQVDELIGHMNNSPFPIILCCDLNELPYSFVYHQLKRELHNAFEKEGNGFGFSYKGMPPFLRIDNQFFSDPIEATSFETRTDVDYSDHYPIFVHYKINR